MMPPERSLHHPPPEHDRPPVPGLRPGAVLLSVVECFETVEAIERYFDGTSDPLTHDALGAV